MTTTVSLPVFPGHPDCRACDLWAQVGSQGHVGVPTIVMPESRPPSPTTQAVVFVGMNPGVHENTRNEPFVGRSGHLLRRVLIGGHNFASVATVYITNGCRCFTPPQSPPRAKHYAACIHWLLDDLDTIGALHPQPITVVTLGVAPTSIVTQVCAGERVGSLRRALARQAKPGRTPNGTAVTLFATLHPAYILRNPPALHAALDHFSIIEDHLTGCLPGPSEPRIVPPYPPTP